MAAVSNISSFRKTSRTISGKAFADCVNLTEVLVDGLNATFRSEDSIVYNRTTGALVFVPSAMADVGIDVEELLLNNGITAYAFYGVTGIEHITVPEGVTSIPANAFYGLKSLKSVTLPSTLQSIGNYAFAYCTSLESIVIPETMVVLGSQYVEGTYTNILGTNPVPGVHEPFVGDASRGAGCAEQLYVRGLHVAQNNRFARKPDLSRNIHVPEQRFDERDHSRGREASESRQNFLGCQRHTQRVYVCKLYRPRVRDLQRGIGNHGKIRFLGLHVP